LVLVLVLAQQREQRPVELLWLSLTRRELPDFHMRHPWLRDQQNARGFHTNMFLCALHVAEFITLVCVQLVFTVANHCQLASMIKLERGTTTGKKSKKGKSWKSDTSLIVLTAAAVP